MKNSAVSPIYVSAFLKTDAMIYLLDRDGFLIDCNHNLLRFLGFNNIENNSIGAIYEMMGKQGLWTSEQIHHFQQHDIDVILSGKREAEQQAIINTNGSALYFDISRTPLLDPSGNILGLMVVLRDQTKQKQMTEKLKNMKMQHRYDNTLSSNDVTSENTAQPINTIKILIVEDNPITQKAEKRILMGCRCLTDLAATPKQADEIFKPGRYDLVLMDLALEEGNGYELTAHFRQREKGSHFRVPIIALTGYDPMEVRFDCDDAEMDGILQKPLTAEQANQLIQHYIRHLNVPVKGLREFKQ